MSIKKLDYSIDLDLMIKDLNSVLTIFPWPEWNQIGLKHRPNAENTWLDAHGSLYDKKRNQYVASELDFSCWNIKTPEYTKFVIETLAAKENFKIGRVRYMRQMPKNGLSIHYDAEQRYHVVLKTNPGAMFGFMEKEGEVVAKCYHIPDDGYFYHADTTRDHFVYNGGWEERIHLVICAV
jgi:hypothetical protein